MNALLVHGIERAVAFVLSDLITFTVVERIDLALAHIKMTILMSKSVTLHHQFSGRKTPN